MSILKRNRVWLIADLHLQHKNVLNFRPEFASVEEHDEFILSNIKAAVNRTDTIIFVGDIAFSKDALKKVKDIPCKKSILVCGNHDVQGSVTMADVVACYSQVVSMLVRKNKLLTHCPIHPDHFRRSAFNIHGHLHRDIVLTADGKPDARYINVSVEQTNYKPVLFSSYNDLI